VLPDPPPEFDDDRPDPRGVQPLGPPGWSDFVAARTRFRVTLALEGLERLTGAVAEPAPRPGREGAGSG
jgi:hypothetical protein